MPKIQKIFEVEVTPEKFLNACSQDELIELQLLLDSNYFQSRMRIDTNSKVTKELKKSTNHLLK